MNAATILKLLGLALCVLSWKRIKGSKLRLLPFFLLFTLVTGSIARYYKGIDTYNSIIYNIAIPIEYSFYLHLFFTQGERLLKKVVWVGFFLLALSVCLSAFFQPFSIFHSYVLVTGQFCVIVCICVYLYEQFNTPGDQPIYENYFFWIASGLLIFNLGDMVYFIFYPYMKSDPDFDFRKLFRLVNNNLALLLYSLYITSLVIYIRKHKKNEERL